MESFMDKKAPRNLKLNSIACVRRPLFRSVPFRKIDCLFSKSAIARCQVMKWVNIVLSVLLASAIVLMIIFYQRYGDQKDAILSGGKKLSSLEARVAQLRKENTALHEQIQKDVKKFEEFKNVQKRIQELKDALNAKNKDLAEFREKFETLKREAEEQKKTAAALRDSVSSKESLLKTMKGELQNATSQAASLKEELAKARQEIRELKRALSDVRSKKDRLQSEIDQIRTTYNAMVSGLKKEIGNREVTISQLKEKLSITFVDHVLFEFGKATITPRGREILKKVGVALQKVQNRVIRVVGHTDNRPILPEHLHKFPSNWELSTARAAAVVGYFQKEIGLDPKNMEAVGRSFYDPVATNKTEKGRAQNRRVNITVAPVLK